MCRDAFWEGSLEADDARKLAELYRAGDYCGVVGRYLELVDGENMEIHARRLTGHLCPRTEAELVRALSVFGEGEAMES